MDVDGDTDTDLILVSAPMFVDKDREGRVYIYTLSGLVNISTIFSHKYGLFSFQALISFTLFPEC